jgi:hypothetical protein
VPIERNTKKICGIEKQFGRMLFEDKQAVPPSLRIG